MNSFKILAAAFLLGAPSFAAAAARKVRLVAPPAHLKVLSQALDRFARDVAQGTQGALSVERVEAGAPAEMAKRVAAGDAEIGQVYSSDLTQYVPAIAALELPFAFRDYDQALQFLDGPRGRGLLDGLAAHNLHGVAFTFSGGFKVIPTSGRELRKLEDFKGLRLWSYPGEVSAAMSKNWGAQSLARREVPLLDEAVALMKKGELDGAEMTYPVMGRLCKDSSIKVINETYHSLRATALVINGKFYQSLTAQQRDVVTRAALEAAKAERLASIAEAESMRRSCMRSGVAIVALSPEETERMAQQARPVYEQLKPSLGADLVTSLLDGRSAPAGAGPSR